MRLRFARNTWRPLSGMRLLCIASSGWINRSPGVLSAHAEARTGSGVTRSPGAGSPVVSGAD
jgi:hypothetical protein